MGQSKHEFLELHHSRFGIISLRDDTKMSASGADHAPMNTVGPVNTTPLVISPPPLVFVLVSAALAAAMAIVTLCLAAFAG